jgi:hypothetical protein
MDMMSPLDEKIAHQEEASTMPGPTKTPRAHPVSSGKVVATEWLRNQLNAFCVPSGCEPVGCVSNSTVECFKRESD